MCGCGVLGTAVGVGLLLFEEQQFGMVSNRLNAILLSEFFRLTNQAVDYFRALIH